MRAVPANEASWEDLCAVFGERGVPADCQCQWFKMSSSEWKASKRARRESMLQDQTNCGDPDAVATSGLVAYADGEPVGWCAIEPRVEYPRLRYARIPWTARSEDKDDPGVWAITCFVTRARHRRRGVSYALAEAAVEHARKCGARAIEGYPRQPEPGADYGWGELFVGTVTVFESAGFVEVARPTARRHVMRIDFD